MRVRTGGVLVTLIDFTLSRLELEDGDVVCCDLEADPEIFEGPKGDCQVWVWVQKAGDTTATGRHVSTYAHGDQGVVDVVLPQNKCPVAALLGGRGVAGEAVWNAGEREQAAARLSVWRVWLFSDVCIPPMTSGNAR